MSIHGYKLSAAAAAAEARYAGAAVQNAIDSVPVIAGNADFLDWFGNGVSAAGVTVTPETAMRSSAVWRCVTLISGALMSMPLGVYERVGDNGRRYLPDHEFNRFLQAEPNEEMSGPEFVELQAFAMLLRGNGYGLMRQARNGKVTSIDYYHPARVMAFRSTDKSVWYRFTNLDGSQEDHHSSYVLHMRGPGRDGLGVNGLSAISYHAQSIGISLASRDYTSKQFEQGLLTNDFFTFTGEISAEQRAAFKAYLLKKAMGVKNAHNP
ncbi:phage portal protein, partial [Roseisolibacter sp. H3M3-2]|uniref:phage portal protein n=1 Tax=Roseisolibacter sp. H3M3-2 TaxID=3031323 RepID=UPI0023DBBEB3